MSTGNMNPSQVEKCSVASPPDTSVSSTSITDDQQCLMSIPSTQQAPHVPVGLFEETAVPDGASSWATDEGEVTSSSEMLTSLWNLPIVNDITNEVDKNPFSIMSDAEIHYIESALCTEEGLMILHETTLKISIDGNSTEISDKTQTAIPPETVLPTAPGDDASDIFFCEASPIMRTFHDDVFFDSSIAEDVSYADKVPILMCTSPLSGDVMLGEGTIESESTDLLSDEATDGHPLDDIILSDFSVAIEPKPPDSPPLVADEDFVLDESFLQSWSNLDPFDSSCSDGGQSALSNADHVDRPEDDGFRATDDCSEANKNWARRQLRRSTRIQENEQREMAEKIRQENLQKEWEAMTTIRGEACDELDRTRRRDGSLSADSHSAAGDIGDELLMLCIDNNELQKDVDLDHLLQDKLLTAGDEGGAKKGGIKGKRGVGHKGKGKGKGKKSKSFTLASEKLCLGESETYKTDDENLKKDSETNSKIVSAVGTLSGHETHFCSQHGKVTTDENLEGKIKKKEKTKNIPVILSKNVGSSDLFSEEMSGKKSEVGLSTDEEICGIFSTDETAEKKTKKKKVPTATLR